ncbi:tripartite tricarboxylate transporter TctB family protein [Nesterenkonia sp. E16_7]|nr:MULTISPECIES: tripartite tricarboxylate transporter TctB family protein [unclassified Nesterenkonia]MBO0595503.1 tripartite tricarboxylate transporter TctB family protein [Nesterenkonia sp. E16_10]MBO0599051.1 tripartite tricarboxylate transporter TctB family protein [Nesterenkonia sp. E16_7]
MNPSPPAHEDPAPPASSASGPDQPDHPGPAPAGEGTFWHGRSGLIMPVVIAGFSLYILFGVATMDVGDADFPGPQFFPSILGVLGLVLAGIIAAGILRKPEHPENSSGKSWRFHSDFNALGWTVGGFLAFAVLLPWLGWILAGGLLFWCVARGFGSRRALFDILVGLFMSSVAYLGFSVALGLNLPSGILGGGF